MVVLATFATVIASQAVISGAFSVTRQAVALGFLPRLMIRHTSHREIGQVYVPAVNWGIFAAVAALVVGFGTSTALASAYGIAVTGTLAIDTILFFFVVRVLWRRPLWQVVAGATAFLVVDLAFFAANVPKIVHGGWFPLTIAFVIFVVLMTWQRGRELLTRNRTEAEGPLRAFVDEIRELDPPVHRSPGHRRVPQRGQGDDAAGHARERRPQRDAAPQRRHPLDRDAHRAQRARGEQVVIDDLGYRDDGISHVTARLGFQDEVERAAAARPRDPPGPRGRLRRDHRVLLPLAHDDRRDLGARDAALAQEAVHDPRAERVESRRLLRAPGRPDGRHGLTRDVLSVSLGIQVRMTVSRRAARSLRGCARTAGRVRRRSARCW